MFHLLLTSAILSVAFGQTKYCCMPDQWQGTIGEAADFYAGKHQLIGGNISMSYDYINKKLATLTYLVSEGKAHENKLILNYQTKKAYNIVGDTCVTSTLSGDMKKTCVPDSAVPAGSYVYGGDTDTLTARYYVLSYPGSKSMISVTTGNPCFYIGDVMIGNQDGVPYIGVVGFYNTTTGIVDPSVFTPPSSCNGQNNLEFAPDAKSKMSEYVHNKFIKQQ